MKKQCRRDKTKATHQLAEQGAKCVTLFLQTWHTLPPFNVAVGRNPMSASSPPSLPRAFLHSLHPHHPSLPSTPSPSPSPPGPLYTRLSNGSHSIPSPTNSRGSFNGVSFLLQIGLTRETVNLEASDLSLSAVKDLVCSIVDQKVRTCECDMWLKNLFKDTTNQHIAHKYFIVSMQLSEWSKFWPLYFKADIWALCHML